MSPAAIALLTFAAAALLSGVAASTVYELAFRRQSQITQRLHSLSGGKRDDASHLFHGRARRDDNLSASLSERVCEYVRQSGQPLGIRPLLALTICLTIVPALLILAATNQWWLAALAAAFGFFVMPSYVTWSRGRRLRRMLVQLPQAFDSIARAVKAGQSMPAALQIVADEFDAPLAEEFGYCCQQQNLGISRESALRDLGRRNQIMELQILVVALLLQSRSGGNLVELLQSLATMVRSRIKFQQRLKALTGEGRMQANILILLPIVAFMSLLYLAPDYIATLIERPWLLAAIVAGQIIGAIWIRRCVSFEA